MPTLEIEVTTKLDGVRMEQFCRRKTAEVNEAQLYAVLRASGGGYVALPLGEITTAQVLFVGTDQTLSLQLGATAEADMTLSANGFVIAVGISNTASNAKVSNASGSTANVIGYGGGV